MPSEIEIMRDKFRKLDLRQEVAIIVENQSSIITGLVKETQLKQGLLSTGDKIAPEYSSPAYAEKKAKQNALPGLGTPDAYLTGEYYEKMAVIADREFFIIDSNAVRPGLEKYGENLLRLSNENKSKYAKGALLEAIIKTLKASIGASIFN